MREIYLANKYEFSGFGDLDCISEVYDQFGAGSGTDNRIETGGGWGTGNLEQIIWVEFGPEMRMVLHHA